MNWKLDQNVVAQTFGNNSTTTVTASVATTTATGFLTSGWASSSTISVTAANTGTLNLNAGDTITIDGVYAVNPQNRQAYGSNKLRNFVVKQTVAIASGSSGSVIVSPAVITAGQFQNVSIPSTSGSAAVTQFNKTGVVSPQNIIMHRNAFTLAVNDCGYLQVA